MPPKFKKPKPSSADSAKSGPRVLYWFRTDLRIHDSPALKAALDLQPSVFIPIWTWDPHYVYRARVGPNRWKFLTECQQVLSDRLTELNPQQRLWIVREGPESVVAKLCRKWKITHLVFEKDTDAYARSRDESVTKQVQDIGVEVIVKMGRTLFDPDELVKHNNGRPTMTMNQVTSAAAKIGDGKPAKPVATPTSLPDPLPEDEMDLTDLDHQIPERMPDFNEAHREAEKDEKHYHSIMGPNKDFAVVTLKEMGIDPSQAKSPHKGGEVEALRLLKKYIDNEDYIGNFEKPNSAPTDFEPQSTTLLSPHHHFGSLSIRKFWWDVQEVFEKRKKAKQHIASEPANFPGQLLFRDMYFGAQAALGYSFAQTQGNKIAKFIPWHLQSNYSSEPLGEHLLDGTYNVDDEQAEEYFRRWKEGKTGFPWIDALMRQLKDEGWIHHLGRHAVACFLTRGGCYVHWERGAEVFEEWLIDHETACNVGNWMWLSCTAFFSQFYRCYSPIAFPKKYDPNGDFVRHYVPELRNFDKKYIYEPHRAPIADQKSWGCLIRNDGDDVKDGKTATYPKPMFDFNEKREYCISKMKEAYNVGLHGDDEKVMSGEWKKIFGYKEGKVNKDETNGRLEDQGEEKGKKGIKRERDADDENDNDDKEEEDVVNDEEDEENEKEAKTTNIKKKTGQKKSPPPPAPKAARLDQDAVAKNSKSAKETGKEKGQAKKQTKLNTVVRRKGGKD